MDYSVYRGTTIVITARPTGGVIEKTMAENLVNFSIELKQPVDFEIGDYIIVWNKTYYLNLLPPWKKSDSSGALTYTYDLVFESKQYDLGKVVYLLLDNNNELTKTDGELVGDADTFIDLMIMNLNRVQPGWTKGIVDQTTIKLLNFTAEKCLGVLSRLANEFELEWHVNGQVIHLTKIAKNSGLKFEYGKNKGLYEITRTNVDSTNIVTRLFGEGGTQNIASTYRNFSTRLQLPEGTKYLEKNTDKYGIIEHSLPPFEDIFPKRIGVVTEAIDVYSFTDLDIDFDVNEYLLPGVNLKITFQSGPMGGYEFEGNYDHATRTFTLNQNTDEKAYEIPSESVHATAGDKYILSGITMPVEYELNAELELQEKLQEYLDKNSVPRVIYSVVPDPIAFKRNGIVLTLGDYANVVDEPLGVDINPRIIGYERDLHEPNFYHSLELAENVPIPNMARAYAEQRQVNRLVLRSPLLKPSITTPTTTNKTPVRREIVFNPGFHSYNEYKLVLENGEIAPPPVYWKDNGVVYFTGKFLQLKATAPFSPFDMPLGFRPWYAEEASCPVKIYVGLFNPLELWGTMRVTKDGQVFITGTHPDGRTIQPNEIPFFDLAGCQFYTGMTG